MKKPECRNKFFGYYFLILVSSLIIFTSPAFASTLYKVRFGDFQDKLRVVFDFSGAFSYDVQAGKEKKIIISLPDSEAGENINNYTEVNDMVVPHIQLERTDPGLLATIPLSEDVKYEVFHINSPPRLVIDFDHNFINITSGGTIKEGLDYFEIKKGTKNGLIKAEALLVDLSQFTIKPGLATKQQDNIVESIINLFTNPRQENGSSNFYLERVSSISRREKAIAAVNGSFFATNGAPLGALIIDQVVISAPLYDRTVFFIDEANKPYIDSISIRGKTQENINEKFVDLIPYESSPKTIVQLISGGPRLLKNSHTYVSKNEELFKNDIAKARAARTALGINKEGNLLLVTVDGRPRHRKYDKAHDSIGATLEELSSLMLSLGATDAMNLDGGGSSSMVIKNKVVNQPCSGWERAVSNALLVLPRP